MHVYSCLSQCFGERDPRAIVTNDIYLELAHLDALDINLDSVRDAVIHLNIPTSSLENIALHRMDVHYGIGAAGGTAGQQTGIYNDGMIQNLLGEGCELGRNNE